MNFGMGSSDPVLGISRKELEPGVEYTFRLTISKDGMAPESTTQTVSTGSLHHGPSPVRSDGLILCFFLRPFVSVFLGWGQVLVRSAHIPMVSLECVSCKAQSLYEVSYNSYVYLKGSCSNCLGAPRGVNTHTRTHTCVLANARASVNVQISPDAAAPAVSDNLKDKVLVELLLLLLLRPISDSSSESARFVLANATSVSILRRFSTFGAGLFFSLLPYRISRGPSFGKKVLREAREQLLQRLQPSFHQQQLCFSLGCSFSSAEAADCRALCNRWEELVILFWPCV